MSFFENFFNLDEDDLLPINDISIPFLSDGSDSLDFDAIVESIEKTPEDVGQSVHYSRDAFWCGQSNKKTSTNLLDSSLNLSVLSIDKLNEDVDKEVSDQAGNSQESSENSLKNESNASTSSSSSNLSSKLIFKLSPEACAYFRKRSIQIEERSRKSTEKRKKLDSDFDILDLPVAKRGKLVQLKVPRKSVDISYQVEDKEVYCICRQRNDPTKPMVQCETCEDWFHFTCVKYKSSAVFHCPDCKKASKKKGNKKAGRKKY